MRLIALLLSIMICFNASAYEVSTADIVKTTAKGLGKCMHYRVTGACGWVYWRYGPHFKTTLKVKHYLPELVVMTYPNKGDAPWMPGDKISGKLVEKGLDESGELAYKVISKEKLGDGNVLMDGEGAANLRFLEAASIGNPALFLLRNIPFPLIDSQYSSNYVYHQSVLDSISWHNAELDTVTDFKKALNPFYDVKTSGSSWGALSPRAGYIMHFNPAKAAGVIAMRSTAIATGPKTGHIAPAKPQNKCKKCSTVGRAESNSDTQLQMVYPHEESSCHIMPAQAEPAWTENVEEGQKYVWVVWRKYEGCINGPGKLVFS